MPLRGGGRTPNGKCHLKFPFWLFDSFPKWSHQHRTDQLPERFVISELLQFLDLAIAHWLKKSRETSSLSSKNFKTKKSSKQGGLYPHWINQIYDWINVYFLNIYFHKKRVHDHDDILLEEEWAAWLFLKDENNVCLKISKQLIWNWSKHLRTYSVPYSASKSKGCVQNKTL